MGPAAATWRVETGVLPVLPADQLCPGRCHGSRGHAWTPQLWIAGAYFVAASPRSKEASNSLTQRRTDRTDIGFVAVGRPADGAVRAETPAHVT